MARTDDGELDALAEAGTEGIQVAPRRSAKRGGFRSAIEELLPRSQFGDQRDIIGGAGQNVVGLRDTTHGGTLYVATTGKPYPVQVIKRGSQGGELDFDRYNEPVSLKAPGSAIDISQLK